MWFGQKQRKGEDTVKQQLREIQERSDLLDNNCGVGLWEAVLLNGDAMHAASRWTWSPEFRRLIGYETEAEYPNVVQSWSDRLHPDDVAATFAAFVGHMADRSGRSRYDVTYRLKVRDGSYHWFRATGGCRYAADGTTVRACGSLTDIHRQKAAELQMAASVDSDQIVIDALTAALDALAAGDLTASITISPPPKMQKLKDDFNAALERLRETMKAVAVNATAIQFGSDEITRATDDLSKRTEQQAASLEETAAALDEITATVRKTSQGATHARDVVSLAKTEAEHTGQVVRQAVEAMGSIEKSASQISQIIGVIDEIAFQTNLLALNAGCRGGAGRRCRARLCGRRLRGAGPGPALGGGRQGDQDADFGIDQPGRPGRRSRRPDRKGARSHHAASGRDPRHRDGVLGLGPGAGDGARPGQHRHQSDGPGHPAECRHGGADDGCELRDGERDGKTL